MTGVSAVIVTYRTGPVLWDCLAALEHEPIVRERIVIDNGNPHDAAKRLRAMSAVNAIVLLEGQGNVGFASASNLGASRAREDVLLFLNPDVTMAPGAAARLLETLANARAPAVVGARLTDEKGREQRGARRDRLTLASAFVSFTGLTALGFRDMHRERDPLPEGAIEVGAVSGAAMMLRRADFGALGGFDEGYFLHVEDIDLCRRAADAGGQVLFEPRATGVHALSSSDASRFVVARHKAASFARYFAKFARNPFERALAALIGAALLVILPLRAAFARR
ncbi:MAG: glycosyltransferase [Hyphomonadaceae bacterium]